MDYSNIYLLIKCAIPQLRVELPNDARLFLEELVYNAKLDVDNLYKAIYVVAKILLSKINADDISLKVEYISDPELKEYEKVFYFKEKHTRLGYIF